MKNLRINPVDLARYYRRDTAAVKMVHIPTQVSTRWFAASKKRAKNEDEALVNLKEKLLSEIYKGNIQGKGLLDE